MSGESLIPSSQHSQASVIERRLSKYGFFNRCLSKYGFFNTIVNYKMVNTIEQIIDGDDIVVEETLLIENRNLPLRYSFRIVELRNEDTVLSMIREVEMLKLLGHQKYILTALTMFRHRQYVGFLFPAFTNIRDRLDYRYRLKQGKIKDPIFKESQAIGWGEDLLRTYQQAISKEPGILNRNSVAYVLKSVLKGLSYVHTNGYIHSQICAANVYMNDLGDVKIGGFLHCRKIGSRTWQFSGNPNCFPPEAFVEQQGAKIKPSFDIWSIGMLTLELISGLRMRHSYERMKTEAYNFLERCQKPPTLAEIDPSTVKNGQQIYDAHVDEFIALCLQINPENRASLTKIYEHKFLSKPLNNDDARRNWKLCLTSPTEWNTARSLFKEMFSVHSASTEIKEDFLFTCIKAIKLAEKEFYGLVDKLPDAKLIKDYIAIESRLMVQQEDEQWSCDVLDVSHTSSNDFLEEYREKHGPKKNPITPDGARTQPLSGDPFVSDSPIKKPSNDLPRFQRNETVFFVKKDWNEETRRLFVALQFARWYQRNLISFSDFIRVSDEIDDILRQYIFYSSEKFVDEKVLPSSVSFVSGLRRTLFDSSSNRDHNSRKYNHIYVEVGLRSKVVAIMKKKFDALSKDDPADIPPNKTTLQAAATFRDLNTKHLELIEKLMLGNRRINEWDYLLEQRFEDAQDPSTQLTTLLKERRRNPNLKFTSYNDPGTSNQARLAKLWSDYDRDFIFRFCKMAIPYCIDEKGARDLYGDMNKTMLKESSKELMAPYDEDLNRQLLRTRAKQEDDFIYPFKYHDEVEARQGAVVRLANLVHEEHQLESIVLQMQQLHAKELNMQISSPAPNPHQKLRRLPRNK